MDKAIKELEKLLETMYYNYQNALQEETEKEIAYREGVIDGVKLAIRKIGELE